MAKKKRKKKAAKPAAKRAPKAPRTRKAARRRAPRSTRPDPGQGYMFETQLDEALQPDAAGGVECLVSHFPKCLPLFEAKVVW